VRLASVRSRFWSALKAAGWTYAEFLRLVAIIVRWRTCWAEDGSLLSDDARELK